MSIYKNTKIDIQSRLLANIASIIPSGTSANIDWNEGQTFDHTTVTEYIQVIISTPSKVQTEIPLKETLYGNIIFNHLQSGGNNIQGAEAADTFDTYFSQQTQTNNVRIVYRDSEIITQMQDAATNYFLTSYRVNFESQTI